MFDWIIVRKPFNLCLTYNSFTVACSSLLVLAAEEEPVSLLLELLCGGALLRAAGHLLHRLRGARLALLPYPVPRLFGWITDRLKMPCPSRTGQTRWGQQQFNSSQHVCIALTAMHQKIRCCPQYQNDWFKSITIAMLIHSRGIIYPGNRQSECNIYRRALSANVNLWQ